MSCLVILNNAGVHFVYFKSGDNRGAVRGVILVLGDNKRQKFGGECRGASSFGKERSSALTGKTYYTGCCQHSSGSAHLIIHM